MNPKSFMKTMLKLVLCALTLLWLLAALPAQAAVAFIGNFTTNHGDSFGSTGVIIVGDTNDGAMLVVNGGSTLTNILFSGDFFPKPFGLEAGYYSSSNSVVVTGTNSYLESQGMVIGINGSFNSMEISGGAVVNDGQTSTGGFNNSRHGGLDYGSESNVVTLTDPGSLHEGSVFLYGQHDTLHVLNGAKLAGTIAIYNDNQYVEITGGASVGPGEIVMDGSYCVAIISGTNTTYTFLSGPNSGALQLGADCVGCTLVISNGATVNCESELGTHSYGISNTIIVDGMGTSVTLGDINLSGPSDRFIISGGAQVNCSSSYLPGSPVTFLSGTFRTKQQRSGNNGYTFVVGDGTNTANYVMQGGTHSFVDGLVISSNSVLSGCGTVTGSVTNYGLIILTNGCDMNFSGPVVNYGTILALSGTAYFNSTFTNNGTLIQTPSVTSLVFSGNDVIVQFNTVSNYLQDLQFSSDLTSGIWTTLTNGLLGTGSPMSFTDFGSLTNAQSFYRVRFHY